MPLDAVDERVRPLPSPEEAARLKAQLLTPAAPDDRPWTARYRAFERAIRDGGPEDRVELLRGALARREAPSHGERQIHYLLERDLLAPIAESLGEDLHDLLDRVTRAQRRGEA